MGVQHSKSMKQFLSQSERFVIFGAGAAGRHAVNQLKKMNKEPAWICDNNTALHGTHLNGIEIRSPKSLIDNKQLPVLIASDYAKEIDMQLETIGLSHTAYFGFCADFDRWIGHFDTEKMDATKQRILAARSLFFDSESQKVYDALVAFRKTFSPRHLIPASYPEYLHPAALPKQGYKIIDGGAWRGDSVDVFCAATENRCEIYSFEPELSNFHFLEQHIAKTHRTHMVTAVSKGLWKKTTDLHFETNKVNNMEFVASETGDTILPVVSLDEFSREYKVIPNLIKMDIEGSERDALQGASEIIQRYQPVLQICVYHLFSDLWEIPLYIHHLNPNYRMYLGHHSQTLVDTVLYAV